MRIESQINKNKNRYLLIPDGFWDTVKYSMNILITGESMDSDGQSQMLQLAMQTLATNPAVATDPTTSPIFRKLLSLGGMSPIDLGLIQEAAQGQQAQQLPQAGSLAAPQAGGVSPQPTQL
jgi:hypothetical protein